MTPDTALREKAQNIAISLYEKCPPEHGGESCLRKLHGRECPCCAGRQGEAVHTCYVGHDCEMERCEWCLHELKWHRRLRQAARQPKEE